jgi:hypothetical protein
MWLRRPGNFEIELGIGFERDDEPSVAHAKDWRRLWVGVITG